MVIYKSKLAVIAVLTGLGLSACGGGSGSSSSSSGLTSGVITGFGSVFVNGVEYETNGARISVDGNPAGEDSLQVGMRVTLRGSVNSDGRTGTATSIEYADELEGIVTSNDTQTTGTLSVMGLTIRVDADTLFESKVGGIAGVADIVPGNIIEVSGHRLDDNTIQATYIEVKAQSHNGEEIEVKGVIGNLTATSFTIGDMTVDYSGAQLENIPGGTLSEGLYVEVKSTTGLDGSGNLVASKIELESGGDRDIDGSSGEEVKLAGPIGTGADASRFTLNGTTILITNSTQFEHGSSSSIAVGVQVKVEGRFDDQGNLVAEEIKFGENTETELEATLESVDPAAGTLVVMGLTVSTDNFTMLKDDSDSNSVRYFGLDDINPATDRVEVSLFKDDITGELVARKIERHDSGGSDKLEGVVEGSPAANQITVAGVTVDISAIVTTPATGTKVEVKGSYDAGTGIMTATSLSTS